MTYLLIYVWEIDNLVIKSDIFSGFFNCKNILNEIIVLSWQLGYIKYLHSPIVCISVCVFVCACLSTVLIQKIVGHCPMT